MNRGIWWESNKKFSRIVKKMAGRTMRMFQFECWRQLDCGLHWAANQSKSDHGCSRSTLLIVAIFSLLMGASSSATAYGISIPYGPINDSVIVRLETKSILPQSPDLEITNWWVEAGSTGFGSGQNDYFSSGILEAPVMTDVREYTGSPDPTFGVSNALVTNLPVTGAQVFLSIWLKRDSQPWVRELVPVITASSVVTPTTIIENPFADYVSHRFGRYMWNMLNGASWYQVWINDEGGTNVHNSWYRHSQVCMNVWVIAPDTCVLPFAFAPYPSGGNFWVRAWSVLGGYGPWSQEGYIFD